MWHCWSKTLRKNVNKLIGNQYPFAQISFFTFFLTVLDRWCHKFSEGYSSNFSTELSSQIIDCCPRNFLIQEERIGNVVSTSHWIRPVQQNLSPRNSCTRRNIFNYIIVWEVIILWMTPIQTLLCNFYWRVAYWKKTGPCSFFSFLSWSRICQVC